MSQKRRTFKLKPLAAAVAITLAAPGGIQLALANGQGLGKPGLRVDGTPITTYYANSELPRVSNGGVVGGIRKFQDTVANLVAPNQINQILPIAVPNTPYADLIAAAQATTPGATVPFPGSDYYEIGIVDYREQMSSSLPPVSGGNGTPTTGGTHLRGYVQLVPAGWTGTDIAGHALSAVPLYHIDGTAILDAKGNPVYGASKPHYLGPVIVATKGTPVRVKYANLLPTGTTGNALLPIPVDETYVGAGVGPDGINLFQQNRAEVHLHGGVTPWISDGTPHQWTVPVGDNATYQKGASFQNVPDMPDPGQGSGTLYWTNDQSARLMFYHDHTSGITRLNVYDGEAAGYVLMDPPNAGENTLPIPGVASHVLEQIPLVIQDRTFVPSDIDLQDPYWNFDAAKTRVPASQSGRGVVGDLWFPHVYETNQDPASPDGTNPVGRWDWAPYFWPVFPSMFALPTGAVGDVTGTPEAFVDTPIVNGTVYPYLDVEPKAYRFRVLDACNDRFLNLGFYVAEPLSVGLADGGVGYTSAPTVAFSGGAPAANLSNVKATAIIGVTSIPNPPVTGTVNPINPTLPAGDVFTVPPTVTVSAPPAGPGAVTATAVATLQVPGAGQPAGTPTSLNSILLSNPGSGYAAPPTVTITPAPADAVAFAAAYGGASVTVAANIGLAAIKVTNDGTNNGTSPWTTAPTVTLSGGGATTQGVAIASVNTEPRMVNFDASYTPPATLTPNGNAAFPTTGGLMGTGWGFPDARVGGVPDPATAGPDIIQIGSEGGLLPAPVVIPSTPINYEYNKRSVTVLNTLEHGLFIGPAERADIVVDFSQYAGKTLILYNDAPAPLPAGDPRLDYYTGDPDQTDAGGAPTTLPGYGPNTRTVMQIRVGTTATNIGYPQLGNGAIDTSTLASKLASAYAATQDAPIVAEPAYNAAFPAHAVANPQYMAISAGSLQQPNFTFTQGNGLVGGLNSVQVSNGGSGYLVAPQVQVVDTAAVPGTGAIATATLRVSSISVTNPGSGYTGAPAVTFTNTGPTGTGVTASATLRLGTVNGTPVSVGTQVNVGGNYSTAPTVIFSAPPQGSGGTAPTATAALAANGNVIVTITALGTSYIVNPTMALSGGVRVSGTAPAIVTTGSVDTVKVTAPNPTTTGGGMGYTDLTKLAVALAVPTGAGGVRATAAVSGGSVDAVTLVNPGTGYNVATTQINFIPVNGGAGAIAAASTIGGLPILNKAIQELFEPTYGRMNATLGVELPLTTATTQTTIPLAYVDPTTETLPLGETQIWKITHNGVDSHPVHFHLVNVQLINRVGWDGTVKPPHDNEVGWKETIRMNPLEDIYVAVKARMPQMIGPSTSGFGTPASYRYLDPSQAPGGTLGFTAINPMTGAATAQTNDMEDFDNEYVWHCHILGHEENDFMRPFVLNPPVGVQPDPRLPAGSSAAPTSLSAAVDVPQANGNPQIKVTWADNAWNEFRYDIFRAVLPNAANAAPPVGDPSYQFLGSALANATRYEDTTVSSGTNYAYYVAAVSARSNASVAPFTAPPIPATAASATGVFVGVAPGIPVAPTALALSAPVWDAASASFKTTATWVDNSLNELGFELENAAAGGAMAPVVAPISNAPLYDLAANTTTNANTGLAEATLYNYQVASVNAAGPSPFATASVTTPAAPALVPTIGAATGLSPTGATINWTNGTVGKQTSITVSAASATPGAAIPASQTLAAGATSATFAGLTQSATYTFTVTSINAPAGPVAVAAATATATTSVQTQFAAPGAVSVTASALSPSAISLSLSDAGPVTGYTIVRAAAGGTAAATYYVASVGATTAWTDPTALAQATTYSYTVTPFNGPFTAGVAPVVNAATGANNGLPATGAATTSYAASAGMSTLAGSATSPTQITLQFASGTPVTGYVVTRTGGAAFSPVWVPSPATQYVDNTAAPNTTYSYTITPWNASLGASGLPTTATVTLANGTTIAGGNSGTPVLSAPVTTPVAALTATVTTTATASSITLGLGTTSGTATAFTVTSCLAGPTPGSCSGPVTSQTATATGGAASVTISGLQAGTQYNFTVAAVQGNVTGAPVAATATTLSGVAVLPPTGLAATMRAVTPRIQLTWTDAGTNVTQFVVERSTDGATYTQIGTATVGAPGSLRTYNDTAVVLGNTYWYRVKAENIAANGVASPSAYAYVGPEVFAVPAAPAAAPVAGAVAGNTVPLSWTAVAGATSYQVYRNGVAVGIPVTTTTATGTMIATNTPYTFTVAAINALGTGPQSPAVTVLSLPGNVGAPTATRGATGSRAATVTWTAPTGTGVITGYTVVAQQRVGGVWQNVTVGIAVNVGTRTAAVTGLTAGQTYRFQISATNASGTGPASATGTIVAR